ncbi:PREDICTED: uncharacterized protein LOC104825126 [Tarenaya hassleriana]|uniref:uncharacterized protein LOC104825126 n=1 Tax=Tarenaya hassleriana TaxID=28532 RepID=UPI00053C3F93|nr:PREDICTED: uncharacterized protein LOC104825126 [Tarenaya hassleriana]
MDTVSTFKFISSSVLFPRTSFPAKFVRFSSLEASFLRKRTRYTSPSPSRKKHLTLVSSKSSEAEEISETEDEWLKKLPEKNKPLYSHSLPCIEAWLRNLGFHQSKDDRAVWSIQKPDWHAQLSLDVTDLYIRYLKNGPGDLERDMERRFSYALSREDIENAVLGGP